MTDIIKKTKIKKIPLRWIVNAILLLIITILLILLYSNRNFSLFNGAKANDVPETKLKESELPEPKLIESEIVDIDYKEALLTTNVKVKLNGQEVSNTKTSSKLILKKDKIEVSPMDSVPNYNVKNVEIREDSYISKQKFGKIIISSANRDSLSPMSIVNGDLILENMRYYKLPCGIRIHGNLIIRNINQLKFCGCFQVDGNVYVSKGTGFGALPRGTRIKGNIIL